MSEIFAYKRCCRKLQSRVAEAPQMRLFPLTVADISLNPIKVRVWTEQTATLVTVNWHFNGTKSRAVTPVFCCFLAFFGRFAMLENRKQFIIKQLGN